MIQRTINVAVKERPYSVYVGNDMLALLGPTMREQGVKDDVAVITDATVASLYLDPLVKHLRHYGFRTLTIVIPPGERQKSIARSTKIFTSMIEEGFGRSATVLALGGGVIGDLSGFIAATYHRGVALVQVPTTLLAQVASSIGGKVAVNHPLGKNMIGGFYQPRFVWTDMSVLGTLPLREITCGLGEIVKYGVIVDAPFFEWLEQNVDKVLGIDNEAVMHVQATCSGIKARITSEDEKETGIRVVLNFGHTIGHALEAAGGYRLIKHGEGVLLGMIAESHIARELGMLSTEAHDRIVALIRRIPLKCSVSRLRPRDIIDAMSRDKKTVSGKKRFVLPDRVGHVEVVENVDPSLIRESIKRILKKG